MTPYTTQLLLAADIDPRPLQRAANDNFMAVGRHERGHMAQGAIYATDAMTQRFWDTFNAARMALRGRGEDKREAA